MKVSSSRPKQVIDLTDRVAEALGPQPTDGLCGIFVKHTTAAVSLADLDPGTDLDMLDAFQAMVPQLDYRHPHDPAHAPDHILAALIGPFVGVPVRDGQLQLGQWQRIVLFEFDSPRERELTVTHLPSS